MVLECLNTVVVDFVWKFYLIPLNMAVSKQKSNMRKMPQQPPLIRGACPSPQRKKSARCVASHPNVDAYTAAPAAIDLPNDEHTTRIHLWRGLGRRVKRLVFRERIETCQTCQVCVS